ncbi:Efflux pump periplasmic linker BepF [BD1-7 clade bacterium]|uniref:Efflux pump periplasmic linker BepF n=1 Tax=BD1-7 clade bacterium TaxID=2029982 RepID=A0A5S9NUK0_9GAMM|nr:Efflux pump periplasmic linker BepF [BD1-7 clade bacterium]
MTLFRCRNRYGLNQSLSSTLTILFSTSLTALTLFGCSQQENVHRKQTPTLEIMKPVSMKMPDQLFFSAYADAFESVDIVARTRGFISDVCFRDGQYVKKGQLLYRIEQIISQAEAEQAQAEVEIAQAEVAETRIEIKRYKRLVKAKAASQDQLDQATLNFHTAIGDLDNAKARLKRYRQDLVYTDILAPFNGRMSKTAYYPGQLVGESNTDADTQLSSIKQLNPLYVYFKVPSTHLQTVLRTQNTEKSPSPSKELIETSRVQFTTIGKHPVEQHGTLDFIDIAVNPSSGTISARATIANPNHLIYPGQSGHLILTLGHARDVLMLPSAIIKLDQLGSYVYTLNNGSVKRINVERQATYGPWTQVTGIQSDQNIVTNYLDSIKPGQQLNSKTTQVSPGPEPNTLFDDAEVMVTVPAHENPRVLQAPDTTIKPDNLSNACQQG